MCIYPYILCYRIDQCIDSRQDCTVKCTSPALSVRLSPSHLSRPWLGLESCFLHFFRAVFGVIVCFLNGICLWYGADLRMGWLVLGNGILYAVYYQSDSPTQHIFRCTSSLTLSLGYLATSSTSKNLLIREVSKWEFYLVDVRPHLFHSLFVEGFEQSCIKLHIAFEHRPKSKRR